MIEIGHTALSIWSYCLIAFTFVFTLLSPFITHGGIESPPHGFYRSSYPPYILAAMILTISGAFFLIEGAVAFSYRGKGLPGGAY